MCFLFHFSLLPPRPYRRTVDVFQFLWNGLLFFWYVSIAMPPRMFSTIWTVATNSSVTVQIEIHFGKKNSTQIFAATAGHFICDTEFRLLLIITLSDAVIGMHGTRLWHCIISWERLEFEFASSFEHQFQYRWIVARSNEGLRSLTRHIWRLSVTISSGCGYIWRQHW